MVGSITKITGGRLLARNSLYSLLGQVTVVLIALFCMPFLIGGLGIDSFGVLTLAWMVTGYFSLFDLGVGRALTKMISERLGAGQDQEIPPLIWSAMFLMALMGVLGTFLLSIIAPYLVHEALKIPQELQPETLSTLYLMALSIPIVISSSCLRGVLEAYQRFDLINAIRIPIGAMTFLGPLLILSFSESIFYIVVALVFVRLIECLTNVLLCLYLIPELRYRIVISRSLLRYLMSFGGWMTVSNIVGPLLVYSDRFMIGSLIPVTKIAYYTVPYEIVSRLMIVPGAFIGVLFPAFGASFNQDRNRTALMFCRGVKYTFLTLFPIILIMVTLAYEGMNIWLGHEFAHNSTLILQWLVVGAFLNSQSYMPFALLHAGGRPDLTAKLHFIEAPFYLFAIWWLIGDYGIEGVAIAWVGRVAIDTIILFCMAQRLVLVKPHIILQFISFGILAMLFLFFAANLPMDIKLKSTFLIITISAFGLIGWKLILAPEERIFARECIKKLNFF